MLSPYRTVYEVKGEHETSISIKVRAYCSDVFQAQSRQHNVVLYLPLWTLTLKPCPPLYPPALSETRRTPRTVGPLPPTAPGCPCPSSIKSHPHAAARSRRRRQRLSAPTKMPSPLSLSHYPGMSLSERVQICPRQTAVPLTAMSAWWYPGYQP